MPGYPPTPTAPSPLPTPSSTVYDCIIIGAGPAGISTARSLTSHTPPPTYLILEARPRIGGRTLTSTSLGTPVDLGASWIHHYCFANPVVPLAKEVIARRLGMKEGEGERFKAGEGGGAMWEEGGVPDLTTALYCGMVDGVEEGKAVRVPSPFPGLGGGEGRFILFDDDGARIPKDVYTTAVAIYNRSLRKAGETTGAMQAALPPPPHPRGQVGPVDYTPQLAANYTHYSSAVKAVDSPVLPFLLPLVDEEVAQHPAGLQPVLRRVLGFLLSGGEQFEGASMDAMSALYWQAGSDGSGAVECDMLVQRGYGEIIAQLGQGLDIRLRHVVRHIEYTADIARIHVEVEDDEQRVVRKEEFLCRHVVVTVPLGVLKRPGLVTFKPPLPVEKQHAIESFGFGLMNKIVLQFDSCWWGEDVISMGYCSRRRGLYRWILSLHPALALNRGVLAQYPEHKYSKAETEGSPYVLVCFSTADVGKEVEAKTDEQQRDEVMAILSSCFTRKDINAAVPPTSPPPDSPLWPTADTILGTDRELLYTGRLPEVEAVPAPIGCIVTRWYSDRFSYGSYSHYALGSNELTVEMLAASVGDGKVGFAGEHTNTASLGCVDSAWETGIREGRRVAARLANTSNTSH